MTCGEAAAGLDEESKQIFMKTVGVEDYQEIALLQDWANRLRVEARGVSFEWQQSPQIAIRATKPTPVRILVHHQGGIDNTSIGYVVTKSMRKCCCLLSQLLKVLTRDSAPGGVHKEPSLTEVLGHGGATPYEAGSSHISFIILFPFTITISLLSAVIDPSFYTVIVPYAKSKGNTEQVSVLIFTKGDDEVEVRQLEEWKYSQSVKVSFYPVCY